MSDLTLSNASSDNDLDRPVVLILGPTAGGKTRLSIDLATSLPGGGECISADSMQIYRGMDIGTAKPTQAEQAQAPHHLIDVADPSDDSFSVTTWLELCQLKIVEIRSRRRWPIIVGGTNLYVKAFLFGLADMPEPNEELRETLKQLELPALRTWLHRVDPAAAERIHPNDRKRTIRAIEVFEQSGQPLSALQTQWSHPTIVASEFARANQIVILGLKYPVDIINRRINARIKHMMESGLFHEMNLLYRGNSLGRNAREALGYKQLIQHLDGKLSLEDAVEQVKIHTRRYAKQQRTWLRRFEMTKHWPSAWIDASGLGAQELAQQALAAVLGLASPAWVSKAKLE